jgi:ribosome-associated protein
MDENWSRTDQKRANRAKEEALARLSDDLSRVSTAKLAELDLPEDLFDAVVELGRIKSPPARNRQLARVRALLRDADFAAIGARLSLLRETGSVNATRIDAEANRLETAWTLRLIGEGDVGLDAFLVEYPAADRAHLRRLVRNVVRATHERRDKAEQKLRTTLASHLGGPVVNAPDRR